MKNFCLSLNLTRHAILSAMLSCLAACDSRQSGASEESVLASFREFYLEAAEVKLLKKLSLQRLDSMQQQNSDTFRTIAYTWNNQSLKECANKPTDAKEERVLSDYDRFVQKEKSNFHVQEIDDAMKPCIKDFYISNWDEINRMIDFNMQIKK